MTSIAFAIALLVLLALVSCMLHRQWQRSERLRAQLEAAAADLQHLQDACTRLAPAGVVLRLAADGMRPATESGVERKVVTALFADIVGYTELSERLEPDVLARVLNGYFQRMSDAIRENR